MDTNPQISDRLHRSEVFKGLTSEQFTGLIKKGRQIKLQPKRILFNQGDPANSCFMVNRGRLKLTKLNEQGKEVILRYRYLEVCTEHVNQRIARSLLRLMRRAGSKTPEGIHIDIPLSRQNIADYSGTTLYTVSRTLSAWEKKAGFSPDVNRLSSPTLTPWLSSLKPAEPGPAR